MTRPLFAASRLGTVLVIVLASLLVVGLYATRVRDKMPDFEVYWRAGSRALEAAPLYRAEDGHYRLKYLPAFALAAAPLGALPLPLAKAVWFALSITCLALLVRLSLALLPARHAPPWLLAAATIVVMAKYYAHELVLGQANLVLGVVVLGALACLRTRREGLAGALLGGAIFVKPYGVIFLPYLVARRQWVGVSALATTVAVGLWLPTAIYGVAGTGHELTEWARTVIGSTSATLTNPDNVSVFGMYAKWFGPGSVATWLGVATGSALLAAAVVVFRRRDDLPFPEYLEIALLMTLIPLISPQGWDHVFLMATPAVMLLVNRFTAVPRLWQVGIGLALATVAFSLFDLMGRAAYMAFMAMSIITLCFLTLVAALVFLRQERLA